VNLSARRRDQQGSAVVDFVLVMLILVPLFLGILQVALVLHVRNTLTAAAAEGARYGATLDHTPQHGAYRTRQQIADTVSGRFAQRVSGSYATVSGVTTVVVTVRADVPPLGLWGPSVHLAVDGHAIAEPDR
jgi:Flp pilus assembly protein TadG